MMCGENLERAEVHTPHGCLFFAHYGPLQANGRSNTFARVFAIAQYFPTVVCACLLASLDGSGSRTRGRKNHGASILIGRWCIERNRVCLANELASRGYNLATNRCIAATKAAAPRTSRQIKKE